MENSPKPDLLIKAERLFQEARAMVHAWRRRRRPEPSTPLWSGTYREILADLYERGPQTVPQLARRRRVSRQHIQVLANRMEQAGLISPAPNPAHRRSQLIRLTEAGAGTLTDCPNHPSQTPWHGIDLAEVESAMRVLERIRHQIEPPRARARPGRPTIHHKSSIASSGDAIPQPGPAAGEARYQPGEELRDDGSGAPDQLPVALL